MLSSSSDWRNHVRIYQPNCSSQLQCPVVCVCHVCVCVCMHMWNDHIYTGKQWPGVRSWRDNEIQSHTHGQDLLSLTLGSLACLKFPPFLEKLPTERYEYVDLCVNLPLTSRPWLPWPSYFKPELERHTITRPGSELKTLNSEYCSLMTMTSCDECWAVQCWLTGFPPFNPKQCTCTLYPRDSPAHTCGLGLVVQLCVL